MLTLLIITFFAVAMAPFVIWPWTLTYKWTREALRTECEWLWPYGMGFISLILTFFYLAMWWVVITGWREL